MYIDMLRDPLMLYQWSRLRRRDSPSNCPTTADNDGEHKQETRDNEAKDPLKCKHFGEQLTQSQAKGKG